MIIEKVPLLSCSHQFVKFVKQVGSGEIVIEDNQLKDKEGVPIEEAYESWSSEFIQNEV